MCLYTTIIGHILQYNFIKNLYQRNGLAITLIHLPEWQAASLRPCHSYHLPKLFHNSGAAVYGYLAYLLADLFQILQFF